MRELSLNVMDLVQNAITAKAEAITIEITEDVQKDLLRILIKDNGSGMTKDQVLNVVDPFYTTRTTRTVGLGVPFFKMEAEMTGGSFKIASELGLGTELVANFKPSSVDMIPLGDVNSTIQLLITCNPDLDFIYRRRYTDEASGSREFSLLSTELREVLGEDVPLNTPDVVLWIRDFLKEQTDALKLK